jgi:uncharacterized protein involved in tolerance to divalent cations
MNVICYCGTYRWEGELIEKGEAWIILKDNRKNRKINLPANCTIVEET